MDDLAAKGIDQRVILPFRVPDDDVVLCCKESIRDLPLCRE